MYRFIDTGILFNNIKGYLVVCDKMDEALC